MSDTHPIDVEPEQEETAEPEEQAESEEEAEEIDAAEAARTLGRKRPRRSIRTSSPELGSAAAAEEQEDEEQQDEEQQDEEPAPKRRRGRPSKSPAVQKHPARKPKPKLQKQPSQATQKRKRSSKPETAKSRRESGDGYGDGDGDDDAIEITVQRFVNNKRRHSDSGPDPLHAEIPFANRSGETVVDVFAQVCEEVIAATLAQLGQLADAADGAAKKKECRIKMRAVEAYREELSARLLQHVSWPGGAWTPYPCTHADVTDRQYISITGTRCGSRSGRRRRRSCRCGTRFCASRGRGSRLRCAWTRCGSSTRRTTRRRRYVVTFPSVNFSGVASNTTA